MFGRKLIRIPINEAIDVSPVLPIIDNEYFQRMSVVRQLDSMSFVYPGGVHTRFEHSLGVYGLFKEIYYHKSRSDMSKDDKYIGSIISLLHDVSQYPYSHLMDILMQGIGKPTHNDILIDVIKYHFEDILNELNPSVSVGDLKNFIGGIKKQTIKGMLGVDKLDYIGRDSYHIGYERPDIERIKLDSIFLEKEGLCIAEDAMTSATNFITSWYNLYKDFYFSKACIIAAAMMRRSIWDAYKNDKICLDEFKLCEMNDSDVYAILARETEKKSKARMLFEKIKKRKFYKTFATFKISGYGYTERIKHKPIALFEIPKDKIRKCSMENENFTDIFEKEKLIKKIIPLDDTDVIIATTPDYNRLIFKDDIKIYIEDNDIRFLSEKNPNFSNYLRHMAPEIFSIRLAVPKKQREVAFNLISTPQIRKDIEACLFD